ncbi:putative sterigmatocystin biosynthesis monooxygenase [Lachnellula willkommii]|uniref:Putative sterigmatocystin biosynthesis monooxygenase n=1 Tax=Lachnellula willkommii TaxID=215461 RepID=A0A559M3Y2_9HELO|nr:putative sterigmatocystin biosynthesis monooxygenase [Lachnellula willkommii]
MPDIAAARTGAIEYFQSLLPPGPPKVGESTEAFKHVDDLAYLLSQLPMGTPRRVKVVCVGAGFGGLAVARAVASGSLPGVDLTIYEKNAGVGGTWYENRYPGCACDIPAHNYQFSWAPNPYWKSFYAAQGDIRNYVESVAEQHDLLKYVKLSHKITGAKWVENSQSWKVEVAKTDGRELVVSSSGVTEGESGDSFVEDSDILINASGFFNNWKWPAIPGREACSAKMLHSAAWPADGDQHIDGKVVALIGNGSSGVQILPAIINRVKKVYVHIRSPTWITTGIAEKFAGPGGSNIVFSEEQKKRWADNPEEYLEYRKTVERDMNARFKLYIDHTDEQKAARKFSVGDMTSKLAKNGKEDLLRLLLPDFAVGCRRPTPGNGFLEALSHEKCEVVWGDVASFTPAGILTASGHESKVESIICATGFDLSCAPRFPVTGRDNIDLQKRWLENPEAYLSVTAADMPNYFTIMGPQSPLGHGSLVTSIELVVGYIADLVRKLQTQNYSSLCPKPNIPRAYQRQALAWLERTAWASSCTSTYKNGKADGKLVSLHPGSRLHYFKLLTTPRYEDFDWLSLCSENDLEFAWLASGFTYDEVYKPENVDLTYHFPCCL